MTGHASLKRRLVVAATGALAVTLAVFTVVFNVVLDQRLTHDAQSVVRSRAQAGLAVVSVHKGHLRVNETPHDSALDERVWIFEGSRAIERAHAPAPVQAAVAKLAGSSRAATRDVGTQRLLVRPITRRGARLGAVVASVSLLPYRHSKNIVLIASLVLSAVMLLALAIVSRALVGRALRPVAWMTEQAAEWSENDLERRFALGPPRDELTALAATLDGLLARLSATLRHEKQLSAEIAHELRTPLTSLRGETELALARDRDAGELREALRAVLALTDRMIAVVNTLMAAAEMHADPHTGTVDGLAAAQTAVAACADEAAERGLSLEPSGESVEVGADEDVTVALLVPLISNAVRYGRSRVRVKVRRDGKTVLFRVIDDGPGLSADELESVFEPGVRGSAANGNGGAGLGLTLARRLARAAGGDVAAEPGAGGRFVARLPAS